MKSVLKPLAKSVLFALGLAAAAAASEADSAIQKKSFGSGTTTLIIANAKINDIMRIFKSLIESGLLIKGVSGTIKNEAKEQMGGFLDILLCTLDSLLRKISAGKRVIRAGEGTTREGEGTVTAGYDYNYINATFIFYLILKCKIIIKINLNLMVFIQEIIQLK